MCEVQYDPHFFVSCYVMCEMWRASLRAFMNVLAQWLDGKLFLILRFIDFMPVGNFAHSMMGTKSFATVCTSFTHMFCLGLTVCVYCVQ